MVPVTELKRCTAAAKRYRRRLYNKGGTALDTPFTGNVKGVFFQNSAGIVVGDGYRLACTRPRWKRRKR